MRVKIRVAILECDNPLPNTKAKYGSYGGVFTAMLAAGAKAEGFNYMNEILDITSYQIESEPACEYPDVKDIDAILITGSRHDAFANPPWLQRLVDYTRLCIEQNRIRVIGVCFGHQVVARALGAKVGRNPNGWEVAVNNVELSRKGQELFRLESLRLHQMHRDMAFSCPDGVEMLGSSPVCKYQGMYSTYILSLQGHPEFNEEIMREIVEARHSTGVFDDEVYKKSIEKVPLPHDGIVVSQAFVRFLLGE